MKSKSATLLKFKKSHPIGLSTELNNKAMYHISKIDYDDFLKLNKGKVVLVVGHSNTIPTFANNLLGSPFYSNIEDDNNSNLYVINICDYNKPINSLYIVE